MVSASGPVVVDLTLGEQQLRAAAVRHRRGRRRPRGRGAAVVVVPPGQEELGAAALAAPHGLRRRHGRRRHDLGPPRARGPVYAGVVRGPLPK